LHIRNEDHRAELLRDCRYFHLRGLEQKVIAHQISYNLQREKHEIALRLEDVKPSGVSFTRDEDATETNQTGGWVYYARPFVDESSYEMVIEIGSECTTLDLDEMRADFHNLTKARISSLFQVVANKMNLPTNAPLGLMVLSGSGGEPSSAASPGHTPLSEDRVKVRFEAATAITLDGQNYEIDFDSPIGRLMAHGPTATGSTSEGSSAEDSDEDSDEDEEMTSSDQPTSRGGTSRNPTTAARQRQRVQASSSSSSALQQRVAPIQTAVPGRMQSKKRKRRPAPTGQIHTRQEVGIESGKGVDIGNNRWLIKKALWRLRVQPNPQDSIRGGLEIVFIGVKIDAWTGERSRNSTRKWLGG
jgi:hypothetical protein